MQQQTTAHSPSKNHRSTIHWPSVWQFSLSLLAVATLWILALSLGVLGLIQYFNRSVPTGEALSLLLFSAGVALIGVLLLPSAGYALMRLLGRSTHQKIRLPHIFLPTLLIIILPLVLGLGYLISSSESLAWILLPLFHILAIGLPVLLLVFFALRGLPQGSPQRTWGTFGSGAIIAPVLAFFVEALALIFFILVWAFSVSLQPDIASELTSLAERLQNAPPAPESIVPILAPYMSGPAVIYSVFAIAAVIVPLIEELIKPIGVWILSGRNLTPTEGFIAGVLCGAGFALFESLALSSNAEVWAPLVAARIGTAVVHIITTGIMGWALALTWREGRYVRLGTTYLAIVLFHGMWNTLTLLTVVSSLSESYPDLFDYGLLSRLGELAPFGFGVLSVIAFIALLWANSTLRRSHTNETQSEVVVV